MLQKGKKEKEYKNELMVVVVAQKLYDETLRLLCKQEMDRFYTKLFQKKPVYKCKKKSRRYRSMAIKHKTEKELIRDLQAENARLKAELMQAQANMDYLSMMTDVDLATEDGEADQHE